MLVGVIDRSFSAVLMRVLTRLNPVEQAVIIPIHDLKPSGFRFAIEDIFAELSICAVKLRLFRAGI